MDYLSRVVVASKRMPGVELVVRRISFARRVDLMRRIRALAQQAEFLNAGADDGERMDATLLAAEIERLYVVWGLEEVRGLDLDGERATPESLAAMGPEEVFREAFAAVQAQCGLSEAERKN